MKTKKESLTEQRNAVLAQIEDLKGRAEFLRLQIEETAENAPSGEYEPGMFQELNDHLEQSGIKEMEANMTPGFTRSSF